MGVFDDCKTLDELEAKRKKLINELREQELKKWKRTVPDLCPGLNTESVERKYRRPFCICKYEAGSEEPVECFVVEYSDYGKDWILYHYSSGDILETNSKKGILVSILKNIELPHYVFDVAVKLFEERYGEEYDALWDELYWQKRKAGKSNWDLCKELYREFENITWDDFYNEVRNADKKFSEEVNMDEFFSAFPNLLETFEDTGQVSYEEGVPQAYKWGMDVFFDSGSSYGYYYFYYCANLKERKEVEELK